MTDVIYLDNAATTEPSDACIRAMERGMKLYWHNPSSVYGAGVEAKAELTRCREEIARLVNCDPDGIIFTSGGSEADTQAIYSAGIVRSRIVTTPIEHKAVLRAVDQFRDAGLQISYVPVNRDGIVDPAALEAVMDDDVSLVSVMMVNNETGAVQPIKELAKIAHAHGALFHTDAVQAVGHIPVDIRDLGVDYLSASGHKFHGPKGVGILYKAPNAPIEPIIVGGGQEGGQRAGTENLPAVMGMTAALQEAVEGLNEYTIKNVAVRRAILSHISEIRGLRVHTPAMHCAPGILNVGFDGVDGEALQMYLDQHGVMVSTGSACNSGNLAPSHVLKAMGCSDDEALGSIRLSIDAVGLTPCQAQHLVTYVSSQIRDGVELIRGLGA